MLWWRWLYSPKRDHQTGVDLDQDSMGTSEYKLDAQASGQANE